VFVKLGTAAELGLSILVVESDPAQRPIVVDHLQRRGFRIVEAEHGGPAIRTAVARPFDYVLADLDWVGVSDGAALARWARTNRPETRVILTSRTLSHWFPSDSAMAGLPILRKPFAQADLDRLLSPVDVVAIPGS
jgi:DNA-binding response OmpR family regulator